MFTAAQPLTLVVTKTPAPYIVIDIETGNAPDEDIERAMESWNPPVNIRDPIKIEDRRQEAMARIREESALLDSAPILCISIRHSAHTSAFSSMPGTTPGTGIYLYGCEREMLRGLRDDLDRHTDTFTVIVGHNVRGFDLPRIRLKYIRHGLRPPACLIHHHTREEQQPVYDTMHVWFRSFTSQHAGREETPRKWPSAKEVAEHLGIPHHKDMIEGKQIPELHRLGQYDLILQYNVTDVLVEEAIYLLMTGLAPNLT